MTPTAERYAEALAVERQHGDDAARLTGDAYDMTYFTAEMAESAQRAIDADLRRRNAKLHRLVSNPSPYMNLMAPWLDYEEGDAERMEDFFNEPTLNNYPLAGTGHGLFPPL